MGRGAGPKDANDWLPFTPVVYCLCFDCEVFPTIFKDHMAFQCSHRELIAFRLYSGTGPRTV